MSILEKAGKSTSSLVSECCKGKIVSYVDNKKTKFPQCQTCGKILKLKE